MTTRGCLMVMCFGVILSARLTVALGGFEMQLLMNKMDLMEDKLQEVEQTIKTTLLHEMASLLEKMEFRLQEKIDKVDSKLEAKIQAMEDSLKKSVKMGENDTQETMEVLKNQLISKLDKMEQQQTAETKIFQDMTQTELNKLGKHKEILDTLTNSIHNLTTSAETRGKAMEDHLIAPIRSCRQVPGESGTYLFRLWKKAKPFDVFCEQHHFGGGWTVIQHRFDGAVDFYRNWTEYRNGFGNVNGEFWLGLEYVHQLTKNRPHELLVEIKDFHGNYGYAKYSQFEIGSEAEKYMLKQLGTFSGTAGDSMSYNKYGNFTTFDRDNDNYNGGNCAVSWQGAWWYRDCTESNLNGRYLNETYQTMAWFTVQKDWRSMSYSKIMIRDIIN